MKVLFLLAALLACSLADREQCPHPDDAVIEVLNEAINLSPPLEGVEAVEIDVSSEHDIKAISCVTMVSSGEQGGPSALSLGQNRLGGLSFLIVSGEKAPLHAIVQAYGPDPNPNPNPNPDPNPDPNPGPNPFYRSIPARFV